MALISDLPNATPQKSDLMEIQNGQTSSNSSSVGQLMQLSASENLAPAYDANAGVYAVGDFVSYNGTLYQCNTAIATPEPFDATKWDAVKVTDKIDEVAGKELSAILTAGSTSLTFTDSAIVAGSLILVFAEGGLWYNSITTAVGSVVLTFDEQATDVDVTILVR